MDDKQALERYQYMLKTAPPDDIERAHEEAFAQLTPEQRAAVLRQLAEHVPPSEVGGDDPKSLARTATRAEMRQPGTMERAFGGAGVPGLGSMFLSTLAGAFVGSAIAGAIFDDDGGSDGDASADDAGSGDGGEAAVADSGGDAGDAGGDFGGGDWGGGDFGGGDFGG
ncbi:MAG: hypothetical protein ABJC24_06870 [Chloroflexota bacterium]